MDFNGKPVVPTTDNLSWEAQVFLRTTPLAARERPLYKFLEANRAYAAMEIRQVVWLVLFLLFNAAESERSDETDQWSIFRSDETDRPSRYTASWAVEITEGGEKMAERIALKYGFVNAGKVRRDLTCKRYSHILFMLQRVHEQSRMIQFHHSSLHVIMPYVLGVFHCYSMCTGGQLRQHIPLQAQQ